MWMYQHEIEEAKRLHGVRKPKNEEMAWAPPRKKSDWPGWEEATKTAESEWRLELEGEAEVPEIIIVSDAVEGRRQMAAAAGKKSSSSLSLFMAANGLEVEEEISIMRTQH